MVIYRFYASLLHDQLFTWIITRIYIRTPDAAAINIEIRFH